MKDGHTNDGWVGGGRTTAVGERVLSVRIEPAPQGRAVLRVLFALADGTATNDGHELRWLGEEYDLRERARALAAVHDLVPVWEDRSWLTGTTRRPPAACYRRRDR